MPKPDAAPELEAHHMYIPVASLTHKSSEAPPPVEIITEPLSVIQERGPEYARLVAHNIMLSIDDGPELHLVGVGEVHTILGISRQRVHQLQEKGIMPAPVQEVMATPIWRTFDIVLFALTRKSAGRPRKQSK